MIKDHEKHRRQDGRKVFRVVDYLECYVNGLPQFARAAFNSRFGIESKRGKVTHGVITKANNCLMKEDTCTSSRRDWRFACNLSEN